MPHHVPRKGWPVTSGRVISCAVVVPAAPLLVPELVPGTRLADEVRPAAVDAASRLPSRWVAVGAGDAGSAPVTVDADRAGTFRAFGAEVVVPLGAHAAGQPEDLPLPALVAAWLRVRAGAESVRTELIAGDASPADCVTLGEKLAAFDDGEPVGLLVVGDGSARRDTAPPGEEDPRAEGFDAAVATALARADTQALLDIDPALAAELRVAGRAPWQVLAGFARGGAWRGELLYSEAPRGVGYHVAHWEGA
ncbi:Catalytic LigB subunit of aromatic ring-opening dioxygenase [Prauserella aidingensis]|nr:Catalytic LigB subunit of aromatic ring-opening dioxygenase [Prauserella aidingensis]